VFSQESLWSRGNIDQLIHFFTENPDEGESRFFVKFEGQLQPSSPEIKKLAAEMLWFVWLFVSKRAMGAKSKRKNILLVWGWSGEELDPDHPMLGDCLERGVGHPGTNYNTRRWRECGYLLAAVKEFKSFNNERQQRLLQAPWEFSEWIDSIEGFGKCQIRHIIKFLLFPDYFERISTGRHKRSILKAFDRQVSSDASLTTVDKELYELRRSLEAKHGTNELDFYLSPLKEKWQETSVDNDSTEQSISTENVLDALSELSTRTIRPDERSSTYDLIFQGRRYPPKLVYSIARKYKDGEELDRSSFEGGEGTSCFNELRALEFVIERKDFVSQLLSKFIEQADAQNDLAVRGYPTSFCGLTVKVSFGVGNFARIPWISFTGYGQTTSKGIYPVYLYYKSIGVLVLAYGVSETNGPPIPWGQSESKEKIRAYLQREFDHTPERYGESFIHSVYKLPTELTDSKITSDLDDLIHEYHALMGTEPVLTTPQEPDVADDIPVMDPILEPDLIASAFAQALSDCHVRFGERHTTIVNSFVSSLLTKPLVILTGLSGSGKTQVAIRFGEWLGSDRMLVAPVRPDWTGAEVLFGYEDALKPVIDGRASWCVPDTLRFLLRAASNPQYPYLLVLDEMNLAHVERYFADVLSGMESGQPCLPNLQVECDGNWRVPIGGVAKISFPQNVFIVGTVNVDETTYMFSPKVLDRANTFEFRVSDQDLIDDYIKPTNCAQGDLGLVRGFLEIARDETWHGESEFAEKVDLANYLRKVHRILSQHGFEFGHRVFYESQRFAAIYASIDSNLQIILDLILIQKVLPRLHGSRRKLEVLIKELAEFCSTIDIEERSESSGSTFEPTDINVADADLRLSFDKLNRMLINLRANQFVSFTE
jgi:5-methylcytosine-specific restriction protein B